MTNATTTLTLDADRLRAAVVRLIGADVHDLTPLGSGAWSRAFGFTSGGRSLVVRVGQHVDDFERDRLAAAFANETLPIPQVLAIGAIPELGEGLFACISTRAAGIFIDGLDETGMRELLPSVLATFDALRAADLSATTGYGGWDVSGNAPFPTWRDALLDVTVDHPEGRGHGWLRKLENSPEGIATWAVLRARLESALDAIEAANGMVGRHLIHSDMLNFNVFCDPERHRISALIDWGCAMTGDMLYDLAWWAYWQPWYPAWKHIDFMAAMRDHLATSGIPTPAFDDRLRACMLHIALGDLAYSASIDRWHDLNMKIDRALRV
ncbi:MAG: aminoglycoside phosphotransferase family protein [Thermomicrobiales bacterium]